MKMTQTGWCGGLLGLLVACGGETDKAGGQDSTTEDTREADWRPELVCPGDAGCATADGSLRVGAAKVDITPTCFEDWVDLDDNAEYDRYTEEFRDCGCDRLCPGDVGYSGPDDGEGDGTFQAVWLAGFQNARAATGVHDPIWARAIVFEQGESRVALVSLDVTGWFNTEVAPTRALLSDRGVDLDLLIVAATHNHEGPDTFGLWGETESVSGMDPDYNAQVRAWTADAVEAAIADLREVGEMKLGTLDLTTRPEGMRNYINDYRDPQIIDPLLTAAQFVDGSGETIAVLAHTSNHPEGIADENNLVSSDFPDLLRETIESGSTWPDGSGRDGVGGVAVFVNGTVGGMMTPLGITVRTPDGRELREYSFEKSDALGQMYGERYLDALDAAETVPAPTLAFSTHHFRLPVVNWGFQAAFLTGILSRETVGWDPSQVIDETNQPQVDTEMSWLRVGTLQMLTLPGEAHPELAIGGYDGSMTGDADIPIISEDNPAPPDLDAAPAGPYWKDHMPDGVAIFLGLTQDELGYIVPPYNFVLDDRQPWFDEAEGDHYEETNSLGPDTAVLVSDELERLTAWAQGR